jgi:hypothetical protein
MWTECTEKYQYIAYVSDLLTILHHWEEKYQFGCNEEHSYYNLCYPFRNKDEIKGKNNVDVVVNYKVEA